MRWRASQTCTADAERGLEGSSEEIAAFDGADDTLVVCLGVFVVHRFAEAGEILGTGGILRLWVYDEALPELRVEFECRSKARFLSIPMFRVGAAEEDDEIEDRLSSAIKIPVSFYAAACSEETVSRQANSLCCASAVCLLALRWLQMLPKSEGRVTAKYSWPLFLCSIITLCASDVALFLAPSLWHAQSLLLELCLNHHGTLKHYAICLLLSLSFLNNPVVVRYCSGEQHLCQYIGVEVPKISKLRIGTSIAPRAMHTYQSKLHPISL